jgi:hypothetical protein
LAVPNGIDGLRTDYGDLPSAVYVLFA